jgi:hypothetical protein
VQSCIYADIFCGRAPCLQLALPGAARRGLHLCRPGRYLPGEESKDPAGRRRREPLPQPMSRGCMHVPLLHQARGRGRYKKPTAFDTKAKHYAS